MATSVIIKFPKPRGENKYKWGSNFDNDSKGGSMGINLYITGMESRYRHYVRINQ